jgi:hypothetical protein
VSIAVSRTSTHIYMHLQNPDLYAQAQADSRRKTHFFPSKDVKKTRRSADVVRRVPRGGVRGVQHESIAIAARTHARTHACSHTTHSSGARACL